MTRLMEKTSRLDNRRVREAATRLKDLCLEYPEINFLVVGVEGGAGKGLGGLVVSGLETELTFEDAVTMAQVALGTLSEVARASNGEQLAEDLKGFATELAKRSGILLKDPIVAVHKHRPN